MTYQREREMFLGRWAQYGREYGEGRAILRNANTLQRIAALMCSVEMSERETARVEKRSDNAERAILKTVQTVPGWGADFQGDPRGACVKLLPPDGYTDSWGGSGWCVPTREY
jgi:hypothetical protein